MTSYEKKKEIIRMYDLLIDNLETMANEMITKPENFLPDEEYPSENKDFEDIVKAIGQILSREIAVGMNQIYKL